MARTFVKSRQVTPTDAVLVDAATVTPNVDVADVGVLLTVSQNTLIANYTGVPANGQKYLFRLKSSVSRSLTWDTNYVAASGLTLPTGTTGGNAEDHIGFIFSSDLNKLVMVATTIGTAPPAVLPVNVVEVNFNSPATERFFNVSLPGAIAGQKVLASASLSMPAGVAEDELEMEPIVVAGVCLSNNFVRLLVASARGGILIGKRNINVTLG
jgi:hypothetical protein